MQNASCAAYPSSWKILEIAASNVAAAAFTAYLQLKEKFDTRAERILPAGKFWKYWKNLGKWKNLEVGKNWK